MSFYNLSEDTEYKVLEIWGNQPLTPKLLELLKDYEAIVIKQFDFNQSLDRLPSNIKFIDLSTVHYFDCELNNLPSSLVGIFLNFNTYYDFNNISNNIHFNNELFKYCENMPYGLKYLLLHPHSHWNTTEFINQLIILLPNTIQYICVGNTRYHINNGNIISNMKNDDFPNMYTMILGDFN